MKQIAHKCAHFILFSLINALSAHITTCSFLASTERLIFDEHLKLHCLQTHTRSFAISIFAYLLFCKCIIRTLSHFFSFAFAVVVVAVAVLSQNLSTTTLGIINASASSFTLTNLRLCILMFWNGASPLA